MKTLPLGTISHGTMRPEDLMINYGRYPMKNGQLPNVDSETGIRYGIIPLNKLNEYALDCFEGIYLAHCPECDEEIDTNNVPDDDEPCPHCGETPECSDDWYDEEPCSWVCEEQGYSLQLDDYNDVWVFKSPHTTTAWSHCSPCAPGAAYLDGGDGVDRGLAYCLGEDWF